MRQTRAYHDPQGDPCTLCNLPTSRHWVRHPLDCICGCNHRSPFRSESSRRRDTRTGRKRAPIPNHSRADRKYWIGLDGEGLGRAPHRYVYLAYSDADGSHTESIRDNSGLATTSCFDFLLDIPCDARVAGYYLGYDWTMILRDMPRKAIYRLLRPELRYLGADEGGQCSPIRWHGYKVQYFPGKMRIARLDRSITVWDIGPFFQSSFVKALEAWGIGQAELESIKRMKDLRAQFTADNDIETYCLSECRLLAQLAADLDSAHKDADLPLKSWHGPGATANIGLKSMGIREKRGHIPRPVQHKAHYAFFGGRFEHNTMGLIGDVFGFDIVNAYPYNEYKLPCLEHGVWESTAKEHEVTENSLVHYHVSDCGDESWAPLPCRMNDGTIVFGRGGFSGYAWGGEYLAAQRHWSGIHFRDAWVLKSDCQCQPFARILDWYRERQRIGKNGKGRVIKLFLASLYGKLAQRIGKPQYSSIVWAGMITSNTRAMLLDVIGLNKDAVKATATDGIYSTQDLVMPTAPLAPDLLGSWERKEHSNMVLVRPGIYWSDDQIKARGLGTKQLKSYRSRVKYAMAKGLEEARPGKAPVFMAARQSVYKTPKGVYKRSARYGEWLERPVRIRLTPLPKRNPDWSLRMLDDVESMPYGTTSVDGDTMKAIADLLWGQPV